MEEQEVVRSESRGPVTIEEFKEALTIFSGISEGTVKTMVNPEDMGVTIVDDDDNSATEGTFTDNPLNRFGSLMAQKYRDRDPNEFASLMMRIFAFMHALQSPGVCEEFMKDDGTGERVGIHPALVDIAATFPMEPDGNFEINGFVEATKIVATEKYSDIS